MVMLSGQRLIRVSHLFSLPILLRTLWAPWRRIISYPGAGLDAKLRAIGDNLVSRVIGFSVRVLVLLTACIMLALTLCFQFLIVLIWPLVPLLVVTLFVKGIVG